MFFKKKKNKTHHSVISTLLVIYVSVSLTESPQGPEAFTHILSKHWNNWLKNTF